jgi:hypothetical protein
MNCDHQLKEKHNVEETRNCHKCQISLSCTCQKTCFSVNNFAQRENTVVYNFFSNDFELFVLHQ